MVVGAVVVLVIIIILAGPTHWVMGKHQSYLLSSNILKC